MTNLSVFSEIGRLHAVAVHSPGPEVDRMTPALMHQLLFDDILFGREAREEHAVFSQVLRKVASEVPDVRDLLIEALAEEGAREHFLHRLGILNKLTPEDAEALAALENAGIADRAIAGWYQVSKDRDQYRFRIPPTPNLLFMRDPAAVIGDGVSINHMATSARRPEPFILDTVCRFHPRYRVSGPDHIWFDAIPSYLSGLPEPHDMIEGGDILVLSNKIVAVGVSIRTSQSAVTMLAESLRKVHEFETLFAVLMPRERAVMHLDTIFTQIDEERCLIFPPLLRPGNPQSVPAMRIGLTSKSLQITLENHFLDALSKAGHHLEPVLCGGNELLHQEREQWTDGANAFCLAPGVILGYSRNVYTSEELDRAGYRVVTAEQVLADDMNLLDGKRTMILIKGNELSRARGGPRCMTMPLRRDPHPG
jgi:arginine deiminase